MNSVQARAVNAADGSNSKKNTVYVSGIPDAADEQTVLNVFVTFGDIIDIQIPKEHARDGKPAKHKGFAFLTFASPLDAQDAIDNYDLNTFPGYPGRVLKVNLAKPMKGGQAQAAGNRAVWANEQWLKENVKPLGESTADGEDAGPGAGDEMDEDE